MRVLIVEDEADVARQVDEELTRAGYIVDHAYDGEDAWFKGETESYAAIVLDVGLPSLDGLTIVKRWRDAGVMTPVLMLTARAAWMERVAGINAGADDYLPKPFHAEELLARLGAILRRSSGHAAPLMKAGRIAIDTQRMAVTTNGRTIELSPLEFRLLRYLMHNSERIVPAVELFEHVYENENSASPNALEVLVNRTRKKLGSDVITTRRGHGYTIQP
jgi:DNA-binding response OmpR family regulator